MTEDHRLIKSAKSASDGNVSEASIPEDVMKAAIAARADGHNKPNWYLEQPHVEAIARAILAEREDCAKIAEDFLEPVDVSDKDMMGVKRRHQPWFNDIAAAIRRR